MPEAISQEKLVCICDGLRGNALVGRLGQLGHRRTIPKELRRSSGSINGQGGSIEQGYSGLRRGSGGVCTGVTSGSGLPIILF